MREVVSIFERQILTEDVETYNNVFGKSLIIEQDGNLSNILNELEDGSKFIKKGKDFDV